MAALELPYPVSVGRIAGGAWSSSVPDRVDFEGRLGVRVGEEPAEARAALARALEDLPVDLTFTGGVFGTADTPVDHPFVQRVLAAFGGARPVGVPYGADMRHFTERGIPTVMAGPGGLRLAHAVDERVLVDDLVAVARGIEAVIASTMPARG